MRPSGPGAVGSPAWRELEQLAVTHRTTHLRDLFAADPDRFAKFSAESDGLLLDYSRQRIDDKVLAGLLKLVRTVDLTSWIEQLMQAIPSTIPSSARLFIPHSETRMEIRCSKTTAMLSLLFGMCWQLCAP